MSQNESIRHKKKKESTAKWFIFMLIPFLNIWAMWKMAELVAAHENAEAD